MTNSNQNLTGQSFTDGDGDYMACISSEIYEDIIQTIMTPQINCDLIQSGLKLVSLIATCVGLGADSVIRVPLPAASFE